MERRDRNESHPHLMRKSSCLPSEGDRETASIEIKGELYHIVVLLAQSADTLELNKAQLANYLQFNGERQSLRDTPWPKQSEFCDYPFRATYFAIDAQGLSQKITNDMWNDTHQPQVKYNLPIIFTFTGQGNNHRGIAKQLFYSCPFFKDTVVSLNEVASRLGFPTFLDFFLSNDRADAQLPVVEQLSLVAMELALAELWRSWGVSPSAVIGHSLGEYSALCIAGVLSVRDTLFLVGTRATIMQEVCMMSSHTMLSVPIDLESATRISKPFASCEISCVNGLKSTVISGLRSEMDQLRQFLLLQGVEGKYLPVPYAFHSSQMVTVLPRLDEVAKSVSFSTPKIPILSTVTGSVVTTGDVILSDYILCHLREKVNFLGALDAAKQTNLCTSDTFWVECGPGQGCLSFVKGTIMPGQERLIASLKRNIDCWNNFAAALATLDTHGVEIKWSEVSRDTRSLRIIKVPENTFDAEEASRTKDMIKLPPLPAPRRAPETDMERQLQQLWASILQLKAESISIDDSFLQIGGDSFLAMQCVGAAHEQGLAITVADIVSSPRLRDLSYLVKEYDNTKKRYIPPFSLLKSGTCTRDIQADVAAQCGLGVCQVEDVVPCTPLQEALLAMTAKRAGDYIKRVVLELQEKVDIQRFQNALEEVVAATPVLRTRIVDLKENALVQVVTKEPVRWKVGVDLQSYLREDEQQQMCLRKPLGRFGIVEDNKDRKTFFVLTLHHALYDGWSLRLILHEVGKVYEGKPRKSTHDFNCFVSHVLEIKEKARAYWVDQLREPESVLFPNLPWPGYQPHADQSLSHTISAIKWPNDNITASTAVRASWAILLTKYTNSSDVVFGVTLTGRQAPIPGVERMIGPTITTVPVRIKVDWDMKLSTLLDQVQTQSIEMIPFEQIGLQEIRRMGAEMDTGSMFESLLVVQPDLQRNKRGDSDRLFKNIEQSIKDPNRLNAFNPYAIMLECQLQESSLQLHMSFDSRVIEKTQASRIIHQLEHVLRQICARESGGSPVKNVKAVSEEDLRDIWNWNATVPSVVDRCVHDIITARSREQPHAPAICAWDGELTYSELEELSTQLAHHLVGCGVGPNAIVPLCFKKSMWMPVAMLGVMKAGGASVAFDTAQPEGRLSSIVQQLQPDMILSSAANENLARRLGARTVLVIDRLNLLERDIPPETCLPKVDPYSRLYVVFTSGSTGAPKGVVISHANFSSAIQYQQQPLGFGPTARVIDFAPYAFDVAWSNFINTITCGACLCIPSEHSSENDIAASMEQFRITFADLTPSTARLIDPSIVPTLEKLVLSGEMMTKEDLIRWATKVDLKNVYGPAECSPTTSCITFNSVSEQPGNIGRGIGLNTWIVEPSENQHLCPVGAIGELWLEGPLVGQGYLGEPAKTACSFVEDPSWLLRGGAGFSGRRGRLYRTGDLVRYSPDGTLVFVGRKDAQVKIRGQRVELGEVEYHVQRNIAGGMNRLVIAEAIRPRGSRSPKLVVFLEMGESLNRTEEAVPIIMQKMMQGLHDRLPERLPTYMVPSAYIPIDKIPMTSTGKTDRRQLREIGEALTLEQLADLQPSRTDKRAPATEMEKRLQKLWASILGINAGSIGADDSFLQ
ncbi:hypothetical protein ETB97_004928, partial [Aspergillus alliaceus]